MAQTNNSQIQLNKIIYYKLSPTSGAKEFWIANYDGTNKTKINIILPAGLVFSSDSRPVLSPDGTKVFFTAGASVTSSSEIYRCNIDGSELMKIIDNDGGTVSVNSPVAY